MWVGHHPVLQDSPSNAAMSNRLLSRRDRQSAGVSLSVREGDAHWFPRVPPAQVQHRAVLALRRPVAPGLLPAQPQPSELPPGGALAGGLPEHALSSQLPPHPLPHGLPGNCCTGSQSQFKAEMLKLLEPSFICLAISLSIHLSIYQRLVSSNGCYHCCTSGLHECGKSLL